MKLTHDDLIPLVEHFERIQQDLCLNSQWPIPAGLAPEMVPLWEGLAAAFDRDTVLTGDLSVLHIATMAGAVIEMEDAVLYSARGLRLMLRGLRLHVMGVWQRVTE